MPQTANWLGAHRRPKAGPGQSMKSGDGNRSPHRTPSCCMASIICRPLNLKAVAEAIAWRMNPRQPGHVNKYMHHPARRLLS